MNITLTSLEALVLKATNESLPCPDPAALEAFFAVMRDAADGPQLAVQALAARVHSGNPREALLALSMLDRIMRRGDASFQAEVGKFRFLNEMIKLVSPKYFADCTAPEVKTRVLQLFHAWSIEYPKESKFKVAYDMLKNQGVVKETPPPLPPEDAPSAPRTRPKNAIFDDEDKSKLLQKLLQSKKPEDLQHANRLIRTMVKEDERRLQADCRRARELQNILDLTGLLRDMLARAGSASREEHQLIHELHASALRLRPTLQYLTSDGDEGLDDVLHAVSELDEVSEKYTAFLNNSNNAPQQDTPKTNAGSLLDFAGASSPKDFPTADSSKHAMDELGDIFSAEGPPAIAEPLRPVNLMAKEDATAAESGKEGWEELDSLGARLMRQSLPEPTRRREGFASKTKKIPMNALDKISPKEAVPMTNNDNILDLDFFTKKPDEPAKATQLQTSSLADDVMVDISSDCTTNGTNANRSSPEEDSPLDTILDLIPPSDTKSDTKRPVDSMPSVVSTINGAEVKLTDISLSLDSVTPSKLPPMTVFEEDGGVAIVLHFCEDKPRPNVDVIVVSTTSRRASPIEEFRLQAVVPKGSKVRLLPPSGSSLPAPRPFLPPPALTQPMLLLAPPGGPRALTLVLTYSSDGEVYSDIAEVKELPRI